MLMWIHPFIQTAAMLLGIYVLAMGIQRFRFQHMGTRCAFNWKRHVKLGKAAHGLWLFGFGLGLSMAYREWGQVDLTGGHYLVGLIMAPVILIALISGLILEKPKGKRTGLALLHGGCNLILFLLACYQAVSGIEVIQLFLLE